MGMNIFDEIREMSCEEPSKRQINLPLYAEDAFDYENQTSKHTLEDMKKLLRREVQAIKISQKIMKTE